MDKFNFVRNGVTRLPPGFRFQPTDEELLFQYLICKVFSCPLPASIIPEINVCKYDPWDLPGGLNYTKFHERLGGWDEQGRYFFSYKEAKYRNGNRMNRSTQSGYWKATGSDKKISSSRKKDVAGIRKSLVFYRGKAQNGSRTDWIMHEYRLVRAENQNYINEIGDWVLCRIFLKKRNAGNDDIQTQKQNHVEVAQPRFFDFMMVHKTIPCSIRSPTSSSSSSSSSFTEVSSNVSEYEETSDHTEF